MKFRCYRGIHYCAVLALACGLVAVPTLAGVASADCAAVQTAEALETTPYVFIGIPLEPVGPPADDGFGGAQTWRFSVQEVAVGSVGELVEVNYDNWYASLPADAAGQSTVVFAHDRGDAYLHSSGCIILPTVDELRRLTIERGIEMRAPDAASATAAAPVASIPPATSPLAGVAPIETTAPEPSAAPASPNPGMTVIENNSGQSSSDDSSATVWVIAAAVAGAVALTAAAALTIRRR